jgi:hypothetical protein
MGGQAVTPDNEILSTYEQTRRNWRCIQRDMRAMRWEKARFHARGLARALEQIALMNSAYILACLIGFLAGEFFILVVNALYS